MSGADNGNYWYGKRVIELGAGCCALPSLTAWRLGAAYVLATDINQVGHCYCVAAVAVAVSTTTIITTIIAYVI
jgi:predicted nicotinamide N-methyase